MSGIGKGDWVRITSESVTNMGEAASDSSEDSPLLLTQSHPLKRTGFSFCFLLSTEFSSHMFYNIWFDIYHVDVFLVFGSESEIMKLMDNKIMLCCYEFLGTVWTAAAHIVTGVIGSGVLSLPWSIAQLGWLVGPFSILLIASSTLFTAFLLCNTYRSPHPEHGPHRSASYLDVVNFNLGNLPLSLFNSIAFATSLLTSFIHFIIFIPDNLILQLMYFSPKNISVFICIKYRAKLIYMITPSLGARG